jgi:hypothetical protein
MKLVLLICTISLLSPLAAHAQEANAKKVLDMYDKGSSADKQSIVTILTAVEDGMGWANIELKKRKDTPPLYCVPDGFGLTGEQILEMLRKEIKENPSFAEESYGLVMLLTFKKASILSASPRCPPGVIMTWLERRTRSAATVSCTGLRMA